MLARDSEWGRGAPLAKIAPTEQRTDLKPSRASTLLRTNQVKPKFCDKNVPKVEQVIE